MWSEALDTRRWLRIALVASAGLVTACSSASSDSPSERAIAGTTTAPTIPSTTVTTASPTTTSPSTSPSRTGATCGADPIVDVPGYLEGRGDAEAGRPYQVDDAPAPTADDDDDDDATVGPQTRYRAGYAQGWCDGSNV
jgi:hypothetical protein